MTAIDYGQLNFLPPLIRDYISGDKKLKGLYNAAFDFSAFAQVMRERKFPAETRRVLSEVVKKQYSGIPVSEKVAENIHALQDETTFTVTTAHQPVLFTGPLYFVYKIISAIHVAEKLKKEFPQQHFVPVYFMGAEDHDFDEINHCYLNGEKLEWKHERRGAVGRISTHDILPLIDAVEQRIQGVYAAEIIQMLRDAYTEHATLANATAYFVNSLFGEYGLVVLNPDNADFKRVFAPVIKEELLHQRVQGFALNAINALMELGYSAQATPREINVFYLTGNSRERIVFDAATQKFRVLNTGLVFSKEEIIREVDTSPEKFSPNVFLRPLYQEMILPNLAYIGGAGELSYWLEQKSIFDFFGVNFPLLALRNSAMLIDQATHRKIEKTGLQLQDFFKEGERLVNDFVRKASANTLDFTVEREKIVALFEEMREKAVAVDATLAGAVEAQKAAALNGLEGLEKKIVKAEKRNFETATTQIRAVKAKLFPENTLQERIENFLPVYAEEGMDFFRALVNEFDPFRMKMLFVRRQ